jgi:hypothetical protein
VDQNHILLEAAAEAAALRAVTAAKVKLFHNHLTHHLMD